MSIKHTLQLDIVSQEKKLLSVVVDSVSIPTVSGEITILPFHIPLFSQVKPGELLYRIGEDEYTAVVSKGFVDVAPGNTITVMVDSGVLARDLSVQKAEEALLAAQETMKKTVDRHELIMAEASLRQAMLELKVARKSKKTHI